MLIDALTIFLAAFAGLAAFYLAGYFHKADQKRALAGLIETDCPRCRQKYGVDVLTSVAQVSYEWTTLPGSALADEDLPRNTFLATCPSCAIQTEYRENGRVFVHPHAGLLDFTRQVRSLEIETVNVSDYSAILGKSAHSIHATPKI